MSLPTPITRKESYLAAIAGEEVQVPEKPITREEAYLDAIVKGGGGGEIIVDPVPTEGSTNAVSSGGTYTALQGKLDASEKGTASGVAELDANGKVLSSQLPSFVDDVVEGYYDSETDRFYEESTFETVIDPVEGKSWVDIPANKSYRWTGTVYVRVDEGVQLGETSNSAFRGDWGKTLKDTMGTGTLDTTAQTVIPAINELKENIPTLKTATGNPITLTDAANTNAEKLLMTIEPVQSGSGDPSPTNVRPISGISEAVATRCGFNIWDEVWELGRYDTYTGEPLNVDTSIRCKSAIKVNSGLQLYFKFPTVNYIRMVIYFYDENDNFLSPRQLLSSNQIITVPANAEFLRFYITDEYGATYNNDICINVSDTNKNGQYEPYTGATATISFGQTVYGGSVNFKTGEVTVTHGFITFDGSEPWYTNGDRGVYLSCVDISPNIKAKGELKFSDYAVIDSGDAPLSNGYANFNFSGSAIQIHDDNGMTSTAYKTYLASHNVQLCYELETPTTLTLTPAELELLKGNNTITANGAEISIEYYPDNAIGALAERVDDKADITYVNNVVAIKTEYFKSSSNNTTQTINIGAISENKVFLFACGFHTNYVLELIAISANGASVVHVPVANSSINSISAISYNASTGVMTITVENNPFSYGRMTRLS